MAAGSTYTPLATSTLGSPAASVTFSSISGAYTDLVLVVASTRDTISNSYFQVGNGSIDTGSNYSTTYLYGNGTTAASARQSNSSNGVLLDAVGNTQTEQSTWILQIQNYANTTTYKTILNRRSRASDEAFACVGLWRSTSAINTVKFYPSGGNLSTGSTFTLYGIAAA
jgi:hypothetical protein